MARIGIDVTSGVVQGGGIGRYTRELVRTVVREGDAHAYRLFFAKRPSSLPVPDPLPSGARVTHHEAPLSERWLYRLWYRARLPLPVQLVTGRLDLFHSPDFVLPPVRGGIPTLLTVHDLSFLHYPDVFPAPLLTYLNRVVPWSVARATHVLADSEATRRDLLTLWRVPADKVTVLYSGVDARFRPAAADREITAVRVRYELGEAPYVLGVGTIQPRKNYQMLIRAFAPVAAALPHNLIIAGGRGWLYDEMLAEVERQGLAGRVRFIGFVDDADLPALYSGAALFVFPSLYEGFGLPLLEAMGCGTPVLTSNASSLPEVAGNAAVQLSPKDEGAWATTMQAVLTDQARRTALVAAGFRQARRFTWRRASRELLTVYSRLLGQRPDGR